jgi:predicted glycogen debranching enzyme
LQSGLPNNFEKLVLSTDNFIVRRGNGKSVIAGYHWFSDWGRDTLISLPGLTLVTKRFDDAKKILAGFGKYCSKGLIPNVFGDRDSQISYNTVDASLWFIDRVYQYLKYTNDQEFLNVIWSVLESIITCYKEGTDFGIFMDNDYLISHDPGLTWMDVKIGNFYSTPRSGKGVEIQALWYNSLKIMSIFSDLIEKKNPYYDLSEEVKNSFNMQFDQLYDVIDTRDLTLRPNIVFLASLDYTMIDKNLQTKILGTVFDKLVTIFGLRTLSPDDPNYKGSYLGDYNKDIAYHNGTAWPWLLGQFIKAHLNLHNYNTYKRKYAYQHFLKPMFDVYGDSWDGSIHEIYDGNPVYAPRGCISQAWSVAEILRCWVEDIEYIRPEFEKKYLLNEISI